MIESPPNFPFRRLKAGFQFSQSALQDYCDCRRRFQLRHLLRFAWPAVESEPAMENERFVRRGVSFHRLAHQYLVGLPVDRLRASIQEDLLREWWENFLDFTVQAGLAARGGLLPEMSLAAPYGVYRLAAKYDLLVAQNDGRFLIFDWKTSHRHPGRKWLAERLQTRLYPYLFILAGGGLNSGSPIRPDAVEMVYWVASYPLEAVRFPYSSASFEADRAFITGLIAEIEALSPEQFAVTSQDRRCAYCVYRSLCGRGEQAGSFSGQEETLADEDLGVRLFDFEQIAELEF